MPPVEPTHAPVVVVGAGAAGLAAGAALKRRGVEPVLLDRDDRIGGTWSRRYDRLTLHTIRRFSGLPYHPIPRTYPRYLGKDLFAEYLGEYARRHALDVRLRHTVRRVAPSDARWDIETERGLFRSRVVVVATGHYNEPVVPHWPGVDEFEGAIVHSAEFRSGADLTGLRVLVVGLGNSGAEIAADVAEQRAADVAVAVRTPPPIVLRELFGRVPVQVLGILGTPLPARLMDRVGRAARRRAVGDLTPYGLGEPGWGPFAARRPAVIDAGFLEQLRRGSIRLRPALVRLTRRGAVFADETEEEFDAVVTATGFRTGLDTLLDVDGAVDGRGEPRFRSGRPTPYPGLYFAGFDETVRGHLFEAARDATRLARHVTRYLGSAAERSAA